jgi:dUTPase
MTTSASTNSDQLLGSYDKYMHLKIFVRESERLYELEADKITKALYVNAAEKHNSRVLAAVAAGPNGTLDAGFDIFAEKLCEDDTLDSYPTRFDFRVVCSAQMVCRDKTQTQTPVNRRYNTGYYMYPRSSLSKTAFRLANSVGIIDAGYRGNLMGRFDNVSKDDAFLIQSVWRPVQICAPGLEPIYVEIVDDIAELGADTARGIGGFGSTGV